MNILTPLPLVALLCLLGCETVPAEKPCGRGMTEANKERLVIDDMEDISDWYCAKEEETTLSTSDKHVKEGKSSLLFSTVVNHKGGEKNYPIGWPRTGKRLEEMKLTDWSDYNLFECWICAETSRDSLPGRPLALAFNHSGHKNSSSFDLKEAKKGEWVKIVIPISKLKDPKDVKSLQFHISESDYAHGDKVDFYIDDMVLTRFVDPLIGELSVDKKLLYPSDPQITVRYKVMGSKGMGQVKAEFEIGRGLSAAVGNATETAVRSGEITVTPPRDRLIPGTYWARLSLRDPDGRLIDRKQVEFRVLTGPF